MPKKIVLETRVAVESYIQEDVGDKILMDLLDIVDSIGHDDIPFELDWEDGEHELYKEYLVKTYDKKIKEYDSFILKCY